VLTKMRLSAGATPLTLQLRYRLGRELDAGFDVQVPALKIRRRTTDHQRGGGMLGERPPVPPPSSSSEAGVRFGGARCVVPFAAARWRPRPGLR